MSAVTLWVVPVDPADATASVKWLNAPPVAAYPGPGDFGDGCCLGLVAASTVLNSNDLQPAEATAESAGQIRARAGAYRPGYGASVAAAALTPPPPPVWGEHTGDTVNGTSKTSFDPASPKGPSAHAQTDP
ncbi:hypothetical protein I546_0635 [Mycobacterium kansasii 732]|nr:hypothetical protein I546_0635 [Mycobacterium kansasii 732]